jgi:hypothetical protein
MMAILGVLYVYFRLMILLQKKLPTLLIYVLKSKHPSPRINQFPTQLEENEQHLIVSEDQVSKAILSFPNGSAAGMDRLRPQQLKDLLCKSTGDSGQRLLHAITNRCNLMLTGKVNSEIRPYSYGASLCALSKKDGGIRPIAIGSSFTRLVSKLHSQQLIM